MYYEYMEVVFIPQVTVFLTPELYESVYKEAKEHNSTTSGVLRGLAWAKYGVTKK